MLGTLRSNRVGGIRLAELRADYIPVARSGFLETHALVNPEIALCEPTPDGRYEFQLGIFSQYLDVVVTDGVAQIAGKL